MSSLISPTQIEFELKEVALEVLASDAAKKVLYEFDYNKESTVSTSVRSLLPIGTQLTVSILFNGGETIELMVRTFKGSYAPYPTFKSQVYRQYRVTEALTELLCAKLNHVEPYDPFDL